MSGLRHKKALNCGMKNTSQITFNKPGKKHTPRDVIAISVFDVLDPPGTVAFLKSGCEPGRTGVIILLGHSHDQQQNIRNECERDDYHGDDGGRDEAASGVKGLEVLHHPDYQKDPVNDRDEQQENCPPALVD